MYAVHGMEATGQRAGQRSVRVAVSHAEGISQSKLPEDNQQRL